MEIAAEITQLPPTNSWNYTFSSNIFICRASLFSKKYTNSRSSMASCRGTSRARYQSRIRGFEIVGA